MNVNMKIAIRWLAIADLALFFIVLVVGVLVGVVIPNPAGVKIEIPCPWPNSCHLGTLGVNEVSGASGNPVLFIGIVLAVVLSALSLGSRGMPRAWRIPLVILTALLVLSPIALYLPRVDIALIVLSVIAAVASLIAWLSPSAAG
jgi:hypothetical protein